MKSAFDEMHTLDKGVRQHYGTYDEWLKAQPGESMVARRHEAEMIFRRVGITFAVYGA
ncbi:MAG: circularly permuted type 2 ATP-grasp protein, partial [Rubrivivax sp.]|nr:circularly permuted type 2 ATP-grasp protein [Rubrivivax sp.]